MAILKYGAQWPDHNSELDIEMACIRLGGTWKAKKSSGGHDCGMGLSFHFHRMRKIIWPELDDEDNGQRWHKICRDTMCSSPITVLLGPASTGKTHEPAWLFLCAWMCDPENTCVLVSSTDMRGLRLRVWGEITSLWERAVNRFPELPGHLIDSKLAITYESLLDEDGDVNDRTARDFRSAIIGIPTIQGGKFIGLGKFVGIKQKHVYLIADEAAQMGSSFLSAFSNLNKNPHFWAAVLGNPNDPLDPLGRAAEPKDGWSAHMQPEKTDVWETRFMNGRCVNLIGTDSPNNDFPGDKPRFPYLIHQRKIEETAAFFGRDSYEFHSQSVGSMQIATLSRRVLTRRLCEENEALLSYCDWEGTPRIKLAALDAAYGGDRCVFKSGEFGKCVDGSVRLLLAPPMLVPVSPRSPLEPEDQIATWVKRECESQGIPPAHFYHDSTGRGSLGTSLARIWSAECNPVEFGGPPTQRPVSQDHYIRDPKTNVRRLLRCDEYYTYFIAELWFSVRYTIEAKQLRGLTSEEMDEGCMREWYEKRDGLGRARRGVETKLEMKQRLGRSPDLMDTVATLVEGARRLGFQIARLSGEVEESLKSSFFREMARKQRDMILAKQLKAA